MREIKFRAWDDDEKAMLDISHWTVNMLNENRLPRGQLTGLKDSKGVEIYEGDIIESNSELVNIDTGKKTGEWSQTIYTVAWNDKTGGFCKTRLKDDHLDPFGLNQELIAKYYEVIGNIHENPDLLKGDNNETD